MSKYKLSKSLAFRRWWADEGVLIAAALVVVVPGALAFVGEWLRTEGMIQPERLLCCLGVGLVTSAIAMIAGSMTCDWWARRKDRR